MVGSYRTVIMNRRYISWLTDAALLARAIALALAALVGALAQRDAGVLPPAEPGQHSVSSSKLSIAGECPQPR